MIIAISRWCIETIVACGLLLGVDVCCDVGFLFLVLFSFDGGFSTFGV